MQLQAPRPSMFNLCLNFLDTITPISFLITSDILASIHSVLSDIALAASIIYPLVRILQDQHKKHKR